MSDPLAFGPTLLGRHLNAALRDIQSTKATVRQAAARDLGRYVDGQERASVVGKLTRVMQTDAKTEVRVSAMLALTDGGATESVPDILAVARTGEPRLRQMALVALSELAEPGCEAAIQLAREAADSELPALRYQGLVALRNLKQLAATDEIAERAGDDDPEVRWVVARLLEEFWTFDVISGVGDGECRELVRKVSRALAPLLRDQEVRVRVAATLALARLGVAEATAAVVGLLSSRGPRLTREDEEAAVELAGNLKIHAAEGALKRRAWPLFWETPISWKARVALAQLGDERSRNSVLESLNSKSPHRCARAIEAAGRIPLEQARPRLMTLLHEPSVYETEAIRTALKRLGPPRAL